jgi:hypothetical protein
MRRLGIVIVGAAVVAATAAFDFAQQPSATQKAVFALEEQSTPGFVYTEDNVVMSQRQLINAVATGDTIVFAANEGMRLHDYTPVAVVTGVLIVSGRNKGKAYTNRYRFTDTWLYRNGKWQAIAAQDYLIPK